MNLLRLGDIDIDVKRKAIKNIHLNVLPPSGAVRISAPQNLDMEVIRVFALRKLPWIRKQRRKFLEQVRETPREYIDRETHYFEGRRYFLAVQEHDAPPRIDLEFDRIVLHVRPGTDEAKKERILNDWYHRELKKAVAPLVSQWEERLGVCVERINIQQMKTLWGTCTPIRKSIRLNLELIKKPTECVEYIVVHEMLHLLEPTHNKRFLELLDRFFPLWRRCREKLNTLPVRHEEWDH